MSKNIKISLLHAILGLPLPIFIYIMSTGKGYKVLIISLPIANFIVTYILLRLIVGDDIYNSLKLNLVAIFSGVLNHFVSSFLDALLLYIGYLYNGSYEPSLGMPSSPIEVIVSCFYISLISLVIFGLITILFSSISVLIGNDIFNKKTENNL